MIIQELYLNIQIFCATFIEFLYFFGLSLKFIGKKIIRENKICFLDYIIYLIQYSL